MPLQELSVVQQQLNVSGVVGECNVTYGLIVVFLSACVILSQNTYAGFQQIYLRVLRCGVAALGCFQGFVQVCGCRVSVTGQQQHLGHAYVGNASVVAEAVCIGILRQSPGFFRIAHTVRAAPVVVYVHDVEKHGYHTGRV